MAQSRPLAKLLPIELVEEVIDHLCGDLDALAACSLVCRAWVDRCYYHRFESLHLSTENSKHFLSLGRLNNTVRHIRTLKIIGEWDHPEMSLALSILRANSAAPQELILDSADLIKNTTYKINFLLPISAVKTFRLWNCCLHQHTWMLDILRSFPGLERLNIRHAKMIQTSFIPPRFTTFRHPLQLTAIDIFPQNIDPYLELLEVLSSQLKLHTFRAGSVDVECAHRAIEAMALYPSLHDLRMAIIFLPTILPGLGLSSLVNLRTLHLVIAPRDLTLILTFVLDLLWNLPSIHIEEIILKFLPLNDTTRESVVKPPQSKTPPLLPVLKQLEITANPDTDGDHSWVPEMIRKQFSAYHERGILIT